MCYCACLFYLFCFIDKHNLKRCNFLLAFVQRNCSYSVNEVLEFYRWEQLRFDSAQQIGIETNSKLNSRTNAKYTAASRIALSNGCKFRFCRRSTISGAFVRPRLCGYLLCKKPII